MGKKLILTILVVLMAAGAAFAGGNFNVNSYSNQSSWDYNFVSAFGGYTDGWNGWGLSWYPNYGYANSHASGSIVNGTVTGLVSTIGGAISDTESKVYFFNPGNGWGVGVDTISYTDAVTAGSVDLSVTGFRGDAHGSTYGDFEEFNDAWSDMNSSYLTSSGYSDAYAYQFADGGFHGGANVGAFIGTADAGVAASIETVGTSYANSYKFADYNGNYKTEGMGSSVGAQTLLTSYGDVYNNSTGFANAGSWLHGGWSVYGGASTSTYQSLGNGYASASANGSYSGAGLLNSNYVGSVDGYTSSQITTLQGANGSINASSAGMTVTSTIQ